MSTNVKIQIAADVTDLTVKAQLAKATITDLTRDLNRAAKAMKDGDTTPELTARALQYAEALVKERESLAAINREIANHAATQRVATAAANGMAAAAQSSAASTGQLRAGFQNLGFQLQDVAVQFASGQRAGTIFAQQLPQVTGALTQMAQAGGNTSGILGRFAGFMSGPWGVAVGVGAAVLSPLIAKLFETGDAAEAAKGGIYDLIDAQRKLAAERLKPTIAAIDLNKLRDERLMLQAKLDLPVPKGFNEQFEKDNRAVYVKRLRELEMKIAEGQSVIDAAESSTRPVDRTSPGQSGPSSRARSTSGGGGASVSSNNGARAAARAAQEAASAEVAANEAANQQMETLAADRFRTEAELSTISLQSKLADIDAEQRAGAISAAQAIRDKAAAAAEMEGIDRRLQARLFTAELNRLEADRRNHPIKSAEYARYTQQIEALQARHLNRQLVADAKAAAAEKQTRKQAAAADDADMQREEERRRAMQERTVAPFAQSIARMLTLQRGFVGTVRDLWGSLVGIVEQNIARMVQSFIIGLFAQEAAQKASSQKTILEKAKEAAANAWNAVVGIPIVGPVLAPIAAAASFAGVMAFASAEQGWDVPDSAGPGIDGRGGRPAVIHPREMVLPASIADSIRRGGLADAYPAQVSNGIDLAALAMARPIAVNDGRASLSAAMAGTRFAGGDGFDDGGARGVAGRRSSRGGGGVTHVHLNVSAVDARSVKRFLNDNKYSVAEAVSRAVRDGYRGHR